MRPIHRRRGGVVAGVLTALLVLVVLAVAGAIFTAWYVAHNVRIQETQTDRGKTVRIETPLGSMQVKEGHQADPKALGIPEYPGARPSERQGKRVNLDFDFGDAHKTVGIRAAEFVTDDSADKVVAWYRHELPHWIVASKRRGFEMKYSEDGYKRFIAIREEDGHTHIGIAQVTDDGEN